MSEQAPEAERLVAQIIRHRAVARSMPGGGAGTGYDGAQRNGLTADWFPHVGGTADDVILADLRDLVDRSRDMVRNNPIASAIVASDERNVIGCGMRPQSAIDPVSAGIAPEKAQELREIAQRIFSRWVPFAAADERTDFFGLQRLIKRRRDVDGEAFARPVFIKRPGRPYSLAIELIEGDRIRTPVNQEGAKRGRSIRAGVELGNNGQPVAYHVQRPNAQGRYESGGVPKFTRLSAWDGRGGRLIWHTFKADRPGQTRGVPRLASVMTPLHHLNKVLEAEVVAKRNESCNLGVITKDSEFWNTLSIDEDLVKESLEGSLQIPVSPGNYEYLLPGESITPFDPKRPGTTFQPYVELMTRLIGAGVCLPGMEAVLLDFSKTSYTSGRMAQLAAIRHWKCEQSDLARQFCSQAWDALLEVAYLNGEFPVKDFYEKRAAYTAVTWMGDGWDWVDPAKDVAASEKAIELGLSSHQLEAAARGLDWKALARQKVEHELFVKQLREDAGLATAPETPDTGNQNEQEDQEDDPSVDSEVGDRASPKPGPPNRSAGSGGAGVQGRRSA